MTVKLFEAIGRNSLCDVKKAIRDCCDIDEYRSASCIYGQTTIKENKEVIIQLLHEMSNKTGCLDLNLTPLMCALIFPSLDKEIIKILLNAGADADYCPEFYKTLLLFGLDRNCQSYALVELISHGASVNELDEEGLSPLMLALRNNYDYEVIDKLLLFGADVNFRSCDRISRKPLMFVSCERTLNVYNRKCSYRCGRVCRNRKTVTSLLNYGADVNSVDADGNTIFHLQICSDLINLLFSHGGRLEIKNNKGVTPLMRSVCGVDFNIFKTFLSLGANPSCHDNDFNTALQKSTKEIYADYLIYYGADINAANRYDRRSWNSLISDESFYLGIIAIVKYSLITENEKFIKSIVTSDQRDWLHLYIEKCKVEIDLMKDLYIIDKKLTYYDFCVLKILKNNKFVDISEKEYEIAYKTIELDFKNFYDFIKIRLEDNKFETYKFFLISKFYKLTIVPCDSNGNGDCSYLNYDCLFEICQKHLNFKEVYNLFLASLL